MKKIVFCALSASFLLGSIASAQNVRPDRDARRQQRQQEQANLTPEQRQQNRENRFQERLKAATPEQRERMLERRAQMQERMKEAGLDPNDPNAWQKMREMGGGRNGGQNGGNRDETRRQLMIAAGITEKEVQDAVIAFVNEQEAARQPLLALAKEAAASLKTPAEGATTDAAPSASVEDAFARYEAAATAERVRYEAAVKTLDEKISFSTNARLKSFLTLAGILNYDTLAMGGISAILVPSLMNQEAQDGNGGRGNRGNNGNGGPPAE